MFPTCGMAILTDSRIWDMYHGMTHVMRRYVQPITWKGAGKTR